MNKATTVENPFGYERVGRLLARYAIPSIIALIINSLYNTVDQIFIGQGVGFLGNGATNIIAPIATITIAIATLFGDGLAAFFSLSLGKGEGEKAAKGLGTSIICEYACIFHWHWRCKRQPANHRVQLRRKEIWPCEKDLFAECRSCYNHNLCFMDHFPVLPATAYSDIRDGICAV